MKLLNNEYDTHARNEHNERLMAHHGRIRRGVRSKLYAGKIGLGRAGAELVQWKIPHVRFILDVWHRTVKRKGLDFLP